MKPQFLYGWVSCIVVGLVAFTVSPTTRAVKPLDPRVNWQFAAYYPPIEYKAWWRATEECLDLKRQPWSIYWLIMRGDVFTVGGVDSLAGYTMFGPEGKTTILVAHKYWMNETLIRHEAVHAITGKGHAELDSTHWKCTSKWPKRRPFEGPGSK